MANRESVAVQIVVALLVLVIAASVAQAQSRLALLIGNQEYSAEIGRLENPHNDVAVLEKSLTRLDFNNDAGPFATVLAEEILRPGIEAVAMFRVVQLRVREAIKQEPYLGFNGIGNIYLAGAQPPNPSTPVSKMSRLTKIRKSYLCPSTRSVSRTTILRLLGSR